jgi:hypothetical protein
VKYPKEWVGFEDASGWGIGLLEFCNLAEDDHADTLYPGYLRCYSISENCLGIWLADELKPLTPAAEDMLALIRERSSR